MLTSTPFNLASLAMPTGCYLLRSFIISTIATALWSATVALADTPVDFARDIRPILSDTCYACHGPDKKARETELRLDTKEGALVDLGGYQAIVPGDLKNSALYARITSTDDDERMPPPDAVRRLTPEQIDLIRRWIEQGARWQEHWSLVPPERPDLPEVSDPRWPRNGIDYFVLVRLDAERLQPSVEAAKQTLIRRVTLDLTGLPPTLAEIDDFLADDSDKAYETVVDRLLDSPRYGEHMAWTWLEAARYGDTNGYQGDRTRTMWPWRDWVIKAFNDNMPFDQFTIEQLAGDLLPEPSPQQLVATGFNRNHPLNGEGGRIAEENRVEYVFDRVETTGTVWMGLTMQCCRCHDHKYDPLKQKDYYRFYAYFNSIDESGSVDAGGNANPVAKLPSPEQSRQQAELNGRVAELQEKLKQPPDPEAFAAWQRDQRAKLAGDRSGEMWKVLTPVSFSSQNGATITLQDDLSLFVDGGNPVNDNYTVALTTDLQQITGLRLEALTHDSFTNKGLARSDSGNFVLTEIEVEATPPNGQPIAAKIKSAAADFEQAGFPVRNAFDGKSDTGWAVHYPSNMAQNRTAMFVFEQPIAAGSGTQLTVRLKHESVHRHHNLGRFRLAATTAAAPSLDGKSDTPAEVIAALRVEPSQRSDEQTRALIDQYRKVSDEFQSIERELEQSKKSLDELNKSIPETMIMRERGTPRETFVLKVGRYDNPDKSERLDPGVPGSLPPLVDDAPHNRLGMARWLVNGRHPLTARVAANRLWQQSFGTGLVKTSEDFGSQGEPPSHPDLLDWLATEYVRLGWDTKAMVKLIVTSATYRQESRMRPELLERDPANRLLARGPRFRLPASVLRDQALFLSGLLVEKIGGPSVMPYQPAGLWEDFSFGKIRYTQDKGDALYRRSLYTFWRRSLGPPNMFDVADRQVCSVRPRRTNTPLHALTLLNDVTFVEAARVFAERIMQTADTPDERLATAFRMATARQPSDDEMAVLRRALERSLSYYRDNSEVAVAVLGVGENPRNAALDAAEVAAYTNVMNMVLNLDATLTKE